MKTYQRIAEQRITILFEQAKKSFSTHPERSHRYVTLARTIAMKAKVKIPASLKRLYCPHCYRFLRPGVNCRVRTKDGKLISFCFSCKKYWRMVLRPKPQRTSSR